MMTVKKRDRDRDVSYECPYCHLFITIAERRAHMRSWHLKNEHEAND